MKMMDAVVPALRVLVVEDDDDSRNLMAHLLTADGHQVAEARNGLEGLSVARACRPDLILLDVQMPVMDGFGFRRQQAREPELARIPVICVSALEGGCLQSRALGEVQFVPKPIDCDRLLRLIHAIGESHRAARLARVRGPLAIAGHRHS